METPNPQQNIVVARCSPLHNHNTATPQPQGLESDSEHLGMPKRLSCEIFEICGNSLNAYFAEHVRTKGFDFCKTMQKHRQKLVENYSAGR